MVGILTFGSCVKWLPFSFRHRSTSFFMFVPYSALSEFSFPDIQLIGCSGLSSSDTCTAIDSKINECSKLSFFVSFTSYFSLNSLPQKINIAL